MKGKPGWAAQTALATLALCVVSVMFSWPYARLGTDVLTRQNDVYGVYWLVDSARDLLPELHSPLTGGPDGESFYRIDSYVVLGIGWLLGPALGAHRIVQFLVLAGPVIGGLAAERCAVLGLGVRSPWSIIAGLAWAFPGLAATAILDGHVYFLLDPFLPLLALGLLRASGPGGTVGDGLLAGTALSFALYTSGYLGVLGAGLGLVLGLRALFVRADRWRLLRPLAGFLVGALPPCIAFALVFASGSGGAGGPLATLSDAVLTTISTAATQAPVADLLEHSVAAPLGFVTVALLCAAPVVLRTRRGWRTLTGIAIAALVLSTGLNLRGGLGDELSVVLPGASLIGSAATFFHFPVRALWLFHLCGGLVAAQVADVLAAEAGAARAAPLLVLAGLDGIVLNAVPQRIESVPAVGPAVYDALAPGRRILDLMPEDPSTGQDFEMWMRNRWCYFQTLHHRPVMHRCLGAYSEDPSEGVARTLFDGILGLADASPAGRAGMARKLRESTLATGVEVVVVYLDLFEPSDRDAVLDGLGTLAGPPVAWSQNAGLTVAAYDLEAGAP